MKNHKNDEPYEISGCGRLIIGKSRDRKLDDKSPALSSSIVGGLLFPNLVGDDVSNFELWDVEFTFIVRRKHRGSPCKGGTMNQQLTNALNEPERWEEKTFDTLKRK